MKIKALHSKEKRKLVNWRLARIVRLHHFYRTYMYKRALLGMLAVLLTILMTGPYACMKIDMINKYPVHKGSNGKKTAGNEIIICPLFDMPGFPGGEDWLSAYLRNNIHYPGSVICGTVFVSFIVTETGHIAEVKAMKGIGGGCGEDALYAVRNIPA